MRAWIVGLTLFALQAPASAVTLGEFASALAVPTDRQAFEPTTGTR